MPLTEVSVLHTGVQPTTELPQTTTIQMLDQNQIHSTSAPKNTTKKRVKCRSKSTKRLRTTNISLHVNPTNKPNTLKQTVINPSTVSHVRSPVRRASETGEAVELSIFHDKSSDKLYDSTNSATRKTVAGQSEKILIQSNRTETTPPVPLPFQSNKDKKDKYVTTIQKSMTTSHASKYYKEMTENSTNTTVEQNLKIVSTNSKVNWTNKDKRLIMTI